MCELVKNWTECVEFWRNWSKTELCEKQNFVVRIFKRGYIQPKRLCPKLVRCHHNRLKTDLSCPGRRPTCRKRNLAKTKLVENKTIMLTEDLNDYFCTKPFWLNITYSVNKYKYHFLPSFQLILSKLNKFCFCQIPFLTCPPMPLSVF